MKRTEIQRKMELAEPVAVVRSDNYPVEYGVVESVTAERRVYHGSRDFTGSVVRDGIAVRLQTRDGRPGERVVVVPANQVKDYDETRTLRDAVRRREQEKAEYLERSKATCEAAMQTINAALEANGVQGRAKVSATHAYGDYRITGWEVSLPPSVAEAIATVLS